MSMKLCQLTGSEKKKKKKPLKRQSETDIFLSLEGKTKRVKLKYWCEEKTFEQKKHKNDNSF